MSGDHLLCGWRVRSELALPELLPWAGDPAAAADIVITEGPVPERLEEPIGPGRYLMVDRAGTILLQIVDQARFLIRGGSHVQVEFRRPEARQSWRVFLLGAVLGFLCHQRGVFPLHAATLRIAGRTVAIAGHRGDGKSTLALALIRRGHELLSDDLTVLDPSDGGVTVLPAFPRLKVWGSALEAAGLDTSSLSRVRPGMEKFDLEPDRDFDPAPCRLEAILALGRQPEPALIRLSPAAAMPALEAHVCRSRTAALIGHRGRLFAQTARIVSAVPVHRLLRPMEFAALPATVALVEEFCAR